MYAYIFTLKPRIVFSYMYIMYVKLRHLVINIIILAINNASCFKAKADGDISMFGIVYIAILLVLYIFHLKCASSVTINFDVY